jgi:hypothetical protein
LKFDSLCIRTSVENSTASFIAVGGEEGSEIREEQAAINDLQMQVGTVVNQMVVTKVQLRTHPPKDIHQDLVGVRNLIGTHGEGMGPETIMETLARLNTAIEGLQGVSLTSKDQNHLRLMLLNYGPSLEILVKKICSKIGEQVSVGLTPVQTFLDFWTDDHTHSGDKLEAKLLGLETNVMELLSLSSDSHNQSTQAGLPVDDPFSIGLSWQLRGSPRRVTPSSTAPTREFQVTSEHYSLIELTGFRL